ncbi:hypothetical protein CDD80_540 [Ophiocordyceps camponoti-rufipedis]|uniref:Uncharacterized protein n=1 Tax=Ophiocordyceps camponoti-rufipedis TaxID=2004952 RepID=A0A2C5YJT7_9HYPO|nr:hypothetical protein CDD80_540 [Ophiocordyceps camponoti-rufipedis]
MDRGAHEYSQSGLPSPYPSNFGDANSEGSSADHAAAAAAAYPVKQEVAYQSSATPTSDYGVYPQSARSGSFPDHVQRSYHPASGTGGGGGGMAQQQNNPSIAAPSPTYPYGQHSPYAANPEMAHSYSHPTGSMYAQPRPDWTGYGGHGGGPMASGHAVYAAQQSAASAAPQPQRSNQVYSFVPIPGAQQHKRPRRRYEEIERMYKCGWNGRTGPRELPKAEFKEIRKEWKQRKKEEEAQRKAEEERQRQQAAAQNGSSEAQADGTPTPTFPGSRPVQLPPIGYQPAQYPAPPSSTVTQQPLPDYNASHMYPNYQSHSPYGQPHHGIYSQCRSRPSSSFPDAEQVD